MSDKTHVVAAKGVKASQFIGHDETHALVEHQIVTKPLDDHPIKAKVYGHSGQNIDAVVSPSIDSIHTPPPKITPEAFLKLVEPGQKIAHKKELLEKELLEKGLTAPPITASDFNKLVAPGLKIAHDLDEQEKLKGSASTAYIQNERMPVISGEESKKALDNIRANKQHDEQHVEASHTPKI